MKWLVWAVLLGSSAMAQVHRDPTLDHHWDLWKKTYGKQYKEKVDGLPFEQFAFTQIPYMFF